MSEGDPNADQAEDEAHGVAPEDADASEVTDDEVDASESREITEPDEVESGGASSDGAESGEDVSSEEGSASDEAAAPEGASASEHDPEGANLTPTKHGLSSFSTSRPVAVLMVFIAAVVFGFFSYSRLPVTLMPELSYPTLTVRTEYPGAAPEEVENDISRPIEDALGVVGGLTRIASISRAGVSDVVLEFSWSTDMSDALQDTLEKLDLVFLPQEAERPLILRFDPSLDPVMELSLSGEGERFEGEDGLRRLRRLAELQVKRALEPIQGVAAVRIRGGLEEEIHVLVDEEQLRRSGLSVQRVIDRLRQENVNVAGGTIKEGRIEYMVRTVNEFDSLQQMRDLVIARVAGRDVRLSDLATVKIGHREREIMTRAAGDESVQLDIYKEADANMVSMAARVRASLGDFKVSDLEAGAKKKKKRFGQRGRESIGLRETLYKAEGALIDVVADRSIFIESSINEVRSTAVSGGLLAVVVLFLFLRNLRSTLIVAVSIPISLMVTFAPLNLLDVSLNIMSLGGLALGIGMLVDSSIVVLESIFRCREEGDSLMRAAVRGTSEVRGAVVASTLTSIAVFFPMIFVEGVAGQAFGDLGLAVVISLIASVVVAVVFIPMLASRGGLPTGDGPTAGRLTGDGPRELLGRDLGRLRGWWRESAALRWLPALFAGLYLLVRFLIHAVFAIVAAILLGVLFLLARLVKILGAALAKVGGLIGKPLLAAAGAVLDGAQARYPGLLRWALRHAGTVIVLTLGLFVVVAYLGLTLESELLPEVHQGELTFELALPVGTPLEETNALLEPVERRILAEEAEIERLLVTVGYDAANSQRSDEGEHTARFKVLLESSDPRLEERVIERLRERFSQIPDLEARVTRPVLFSFRTPVEVEIHGDNLDRLQDWSQRVSGSMASIPELADLEATLRPGAPEMQIVYDRDRLARFDLDIQQVATLVRDAVKGFEATRYNLTDRRIPIIVRFDEDDRASVEDVRRIEVNPGAERSIPLSAVAAVELGEGPSEVRRIDNRRVALVRANLADGSLGAAVGSIESELDELPWPSDMTFYLTGQNQEWERSRGSLFLALGLSIFLVYVIMAAQFESLVHPLVIMFTIPLAFLGTFAGLHAMGISLSIVVFLGMIMLAGIVVNNAIVLVDYTNRLRDRGLQLEEAVVAAGRVRLRPILMTTATTVLGLTPMALGLGDGAEIRRPMAIAVISGLVVSTVLTLVIIPTVYTLLDRLQIALIGDRRRREDTAVELEGSAVLS
ncbi:MAG: efflux RND transporter permease subunit [Acidobacteriota bacterium]